MIIDWIKDLPPHHQFYITHNGHHTNYETMDDYLNNDFIKSDISYEDAQECLKTNSVWELQIYPITQISFYKTVAATFEKAMELLLENYNFTDGRWL